MVKLNLGCGSNKIEGCINVDIEAEVKPDIIADFRSHIPYSPDSVDVIYLFHVIEHIEEVHHFNILREIWRVLKPDGMLFISYPEFTAIAKNYIENVAGRRDFWKATIYGRQLYKSDYHVALMDTTYFRPFLQESGFKDIVVAQEVYQDFNTIIRCKKGEFNDYEALVKSKVFDSATLRD